MLDSLEDRARLVTFEAAALALPRVPRAVGLGIALGAVPGYDVTVSGIDFDHCIAAGKLNARVRAVIELAKSYAEMSPSGNGVHVLGLSDIGTTKKGTGLEIYSGKRFFTVTGEPLELSRARLSDLTDAAALARKLYRASTEKPKIFKPKVITPAAAQQAVKEFAALLQRLKLLKMHLRQRGGKHDIRCPWSHEHSHGDISGSTLLEPSESNNWSGGYFCAHKHCDGRGIHSIHAWMLDRVRRAWAAGLQKKAS